MALRHPDRPFNFDDAYMARVGEALKHNHIIIYQNHAYLLVAKTVAEAVLLAYMLNKACELQVKILSTGDPVRDTVPGSVRASLCCLLRQPECGLRSLRVDPSFRD